MRIAFVNTLYPPHGAGGAEATLRLLTSGLMRRGHDCTVLTLTPERAERSRLIDDVPVRYLPLANLYWPHSGRRPRALRPLFQAMDAYNPVMRRRLRRVLAETGPDVVHCHNLQGFSVSAWAAADALGIPVVQTLHDYYLACPRSTMWRPDRGNCQVQCPECRLFSAPRRRLSHLPHAFTSVSHRVLDRLSAAGLFGAPPRACVIRGNNPPGTASVQAARPPGGPLRLGFLGRLEPAKGLETLLDTLAGLPAGAASLEIAGTGAPDYEAGLRARAAAHRGNVRFLGHVAPGDLLGRIDLLVVPSVWEDPFPRVVHEAQAFGVPSLASPLGGLPEAIAHGRTGFLAAAPTAEALREALERLLREGWDRSAMRAACLQAAQAYAEDSILDRYEAALRAAARRAPLPSEAGEPWPRATWHPAPDAAAVPADLAESGAP